MSPDQFPEPDWRTLRKLQPILLDRLCRRVLKEIEFAASDTSREAHETYLKLVELAQRRDRDIADGFNDMRRSTATLRIFHLRRLDLMTDEEFARFSAETCAEVQHMIGWAQR